MKVICLKCSENLINKLNKYGEWLGYEFTMCEDFNQIIKLTSKNAIVGILVDIDDHKNEMYYLTSKLKNTINIPIFFISSNYDRNERVRWLTIGASDYILKPFVVEEIIMKLKQVSLTSEQQVIYSDKIVINLLTQEVYYDGSEINLTPKEFSILSYFIINNDKVISREDFMQDVFKTDFFISSRSVDTLVKNLRHKIPQLNIIAIRGVGYKYVTN